MGTALRRGSPVVVDVPLQIRFVLIQRYMDMSMRNGRLSLASFGVLLFGLGYEAPLVPRVVAWLALGLIYLVRVGLVRRLAARLDPTAPRTDRLYDVLLLIASSVWGVAPFAFQPWVSTINLYCIMYAAAVATSLLAVSYIAALPAGCVLVAASVLPLVAFFLLQGSYVLGALALGTVICTLALLGRVASSHATLLQALASERQNAALVQELQTYRRALETENASLDSSLRAASRDASRDPLTGLYNRRHVTTYGRSLGDAMASSHEEVTLCMIDVDHFKQVNDRHGHLVGDEVLCAVAALLQARLRDGDCLARIGGEEFLAVLRQCDLTRGRRVAESVRHNVAASQIRTRMGEVPVTVSIGLAQWTPGEAFEQVLERADRALYDAKHSGRDRVEIDFGSRVGTGQLFSDSSHGPLH